MSVFCLIQKCIEEKQKNLLCSYGTGLLFIVEMALWPSHRSMSMY